MFDNLHRRLAKVHTEMARHHAEREQRGLRGPRQPKEMDDAELLAVITQGYGFTPEEQPIVERFFEIITGEIGADLSLPMKDQQFHGGINPDVPRNVETMYRLLFTDGNFQEKRDIIKCLVASADAEPDRKDHIKQFIDLAHAGGDSANDGAVP
jgi:hypothetical protein